MTARFRITPRARQDLIDIGRYTAERWGSRQRDDYLRELDRRFSWLADNPRLGRHRPDVRTGYFSFRQGSHVIFYLIRDGGIDIIGIPHQRMDVVDYFSTDD